MGRKRKSTEILEILNEKPVTESIPTPAVSDSDDRGPQPVDSPVLDPGPSPDTMVETVTPPQSIPVPSLPPPNIPKKTRIRKEKDPLAEEMKKIRKNQEDYRRFQEEQEKRLESRLESMLTRKLDFMKPVPVQRPVHAYKPKQPATVKRFIPPPDEYEEYLTQEEEEDEENSLFSKIFS
jgi:hypothetical protein